MIIHPSVLQGSDEWFEMRRGRPTASRFKAIVEPSTGLLSKNKKGDKISDKALGYIAELIGETFAPHWVEFAGNKFTDRGTEMEPMARAAFEKLTGLEVEEVGFCTRKDGVVGCSPDGLLKVRTEGLEIKCPSPSKHVEYVYEGILPPEYRAQVHGGMAVTGLDRWHFFSFFPGLQPLHLIVHRDDYTNNISTALDEFIIEYQAIRAAVIPKLQIKK